MADPQRAWLSGAFVVLGAVIAASAGVAGPLALQARQDRRDDRQAAEQARGAARVLFVEFLEAAGQMTVLEHDRILRRFDRSFAISLPTEDYKLIAAKLDGERWGIVQQASVNVGALETFVNSLTERGRRRLTDGEACFVRADLRSIRYAAGALAVLADAPGKDTPPGRVECGTKARPYGG